jgi:hypothetical protein
MHPSKLKVALVSLALIALAGCTGGIQAGGESPTNNGGIAWVAMSGMLILTGIILWIILGRED